MKSMKTANMEQKSRIKSTRKDLLALALFMNSRAESVQQNMMVVALFWGIRFVHLSKEQ